MKKFLVKLSGFIFIMTVVLCATIYISTKESYSAFIAEMTNSTAYSDEATREIIPYLENAGNKESNYSKLIIGDSVCHQMLNPFQEFNKSYAILGSNAAITMIGQCLLAEKFVENHAQTTDVYLVMRAFPGGGVSSEKLAYQYLVVPFTLNQELEQMAPETIEQLKEIYGEFFLKRKVIEKIEQSPLLKKLYLNILRDAKVDDIAIGIQYLERLEKFCAGRNITLHLLHAPVSENAKGNVEEEKVKVTGYSCSEGVEKLLQKFYGMVNYYPEDEFRDGIHMTNEKSSLDELKNYIFDLQDASGELKDFKTIKD